MDRLIGVQMKFGQQLRQLYMVAVEVLRIEAIKSIDREYLS